MQLQVDFQRAFDSVEHKFLYRTLECMGFSSYIIKLIKIAFHGCFSYININGYLSPPVYLCRGLHQGSPLSPVLFLLVAQVFTKRLEINNDVQGMTINGVDLLLSLYADDTDMFLSATFSCISAVILELDTFGRASGCKANIDKTKCIPLGKSRSNISLITQLKANYSPNFVTDDFVALGIQFNNSQTAGQIAELNYTTKLEKAINKVKFWMSRDLTIYGRVTLIKSIIMSQFVYLIIPLLRPKKDIIGRINKLVFNFLWGGKPDKIKRDVVTQPLNLGGINMLYPIDFIDSLKLKLIQKIFDPEFKHHWKDIIRMQFICPEQAYISFENNLVDSKYGFTKDLCNCYQEWKSKVAMNDGKCINHCIWGNRDFLDLSSKHWKTKLIEYQLVHLSDFINEDGTIMTYRDFCINTLSGSWQVISATEYVNIRMAIRRFHTPSQSTRNVSNIDDEICLRFFTQTTQRQLRGRRIREKGVKLQKPEELPALKAWGQNMELENINWKAVFNNLYSKFTNNFKLIQFQYKLLMRVSTCRYSRFKMKIDRESSFCYHCKDEEETLYHIYLACPMSLLLRSRVSRYIKDNIDEHYEDQCDLKYLTCGYDNRVINYMLAVTKYYLSHTYQWQKEISWAAFKNFVLLLLVGENKDMAGVIAGTLVGTG